MGGQSHRRQRKLAYRRRVVSSSESSLGTDLVSGLSSPLAGPFCSGALPAPESPVVRPPLVDYSSSSAAASPPSSLSVLRRSARLAAASPGQDAQSSRGLVLASSPPRTPVGSARRVRVPAAVRNLQTYFAYPFFPLFRREYWLTCRHRSLVRQLLGGQLDDQNDWSDRSVFVVRRGSGREGSLQYATADKMWLSGSEGPATGRDVVGAVIVLQATTSARR